MTMFIRLDYNRLVVFIKGLEEQKKKKVYKHFSREHYSFLLIY